MNLRSLSQILIFCLLCISCGDKKSLSVLYNVDDMVNNRHDIYTAYELTLAPLKEEFHKTDSYSRRWELADSLHNAYVNFSLDSTFEYIRLQHYYSTTAKQKYISILNEVNALAYRHNESHAEKLFLSLDREQIQKHGLEKQYLKSGITLYSYMYLYSGQLSRETASLKVNQYREQYIALDTLSYYGKKTLVLCLKRKGEYDRAIEMLQAISETETENHNLSSIYYNLASIYGIIGDDEKRFESLIKSVEYDFKSPVRNYLSLYELALMLYDRGMLEKASIYISANLSDAIAGNFNTRMINSGRSQMIISEATKHEDEIKFYWLLSAMCCFFIMLAVMCVLFVYNRIHARKLRDIKNILLETNARLKRVNADLIYANKIKDSYVFSYMELSIKYLEKIEETRREIRTAGRTGGLEQIMKLLRSPSAIYDEYKRYYQVFDEAFLGIFPDFITKVNSLLVEEERFPIPEEKVLSTELRMLAAIRLGITESGQIATFLKCSPATIYSYKSRLKRASICAKDKFEEKISML